MKWKSLAGRAAGLLAALLIISGAVLIAIGTRQPGASRPQTVTSPQVGTAKNPALSQPASSQSAVPSRLRVPAIGVDAAIEPVGVTAQHDMDVPRNPQDVGWYEGGPQPGQAGDAVIDGHLDWVSGPAVFWNLRELRAGDQLQVTDASGQARAFQVTSLASFAADSPPPPDLFNNAGPPRLSLITCAGDWHGTEYSQRLVVEASPAGSS